MEKSSVKLIDQPKLPHEFRIAECRTYRDTAEAIRTMVVRGAPAIGATACYGMAQAALAGEDLATAEKVLSSTRPTAHDLFDGIRYFRINYKGKNPASVAESYANASAERCRMIGVHGAKLVKDGMRVLTHCNAGALGCVDWGTALAPLRVAKNNGVNFFVWVDETRPRFQGAGLTAWEMVQENIPHAVIADNAAGYFMRKGEVDLVIVGADRITANGDVANKIGTYEKAVLAKENGIPFYVAAPSSTIDKSLSSGEEIPIEERSEEEVHYVFGIKENGKTGKVRVTPKNSRARNPAFDVTPAKYMTGYITEKGISKKLQ
jgi:translation initiation factor eIF-2B subunit alpha/methylthioribose-1-phosphate isomerase